MELLDKINGFIENLEIKTFYKYLAIIISCIVLLAGIIVFRYYRNITALQSKLVEINEERAKVQEILTKLQSVKEQRAEVDRMLDEKEQFYIKDYFLKLTTQLGIKNMKTDRQRVTPLTGDERYSESELNIEFTQMDMKQLTELLQELSKNKRIYTKEIEIAKSPKQPKIEVKLTIGTLIKKSTMP